MSASVKNAFIKYAARVVYVSSWGDWMEENGRGAELSGREMMEMAPKRTPLSATRWARRLVATMEKMNGLSLSTMWEHAKAGGSFGGKVPTIEDFAFCTAMEALGHGVGWGDDHPEHGFFIPSAEFYLNSETTGDGYVSERKEMARRG